MNVCPKCGTYYEGNFCPKGCNSQANKKKKKTKLIIVIVAAVLVIGGIGGVIATITFNSDIKFAEECIASGNFDGAKEVLDKQLTTNSSFDAVYLTYADLYIAQEDYSGAIDILEEGRNHCSSAENLENKINEIQNNYAVELEAERLEEEKIAEEAEQEAKRKQDEMNAEKLGISVESFYDVYDKLRLVGLSDTEISLYKLDDWANGKRVGTDYESVSIVIYLNEAGQVETIRSGDVVFFDAGEVKNAVKDLVVTDSMKSQLKTWTVETVTDCLKSPSSAEFPGGILTPYEDWNFAKDGDLYTVSSYVDSQNSFGAMIRSDFVAKFNYGESVTLTYLSIDGQVIVG